MSHWNEAAVTDAGTEMLNEMMAGRKLTLTAAYGGTGLVDVGDLEKQTGLLDQKQKFSITDEQTDETGKIITLQIVNADAEYELNQVGVFAKLDAGRETETPEKMLFLMQDREGVTIPDMKDQAFMLELFCVIKIINNGRFEVEIDKTGVVSHAYLERKLAEHNTDPNAHLMPDDADEGTKYRLGVERGKIYIQTVEEE